MSIISDALKKAGKKVHPDLTEAAPKALGEEKAPSLPIDQPRPAETKLQKATRFVTERKKAVIEYTALGVILIALVISMFGVFNRPKHADVAPQQAIEDISPTPELTTAVAPSKSEIANLSRAAHDVSGLILTGISEGAGKPVAIINNNILSTGDTVKGYTVEEIFGNRVRLSKGDEELVLELK